MYIYIYIYIGTFALGANYHVLYWRMYHSDCSRTYAELP